MKITRRSLAVLACATLAILPACSATDTSSTPTSTVDPLVGVPKTDAALVAKLPSELKPGGVLRVATDGTYAPMDFTVGGDLGGQPGSGTPAPDEGAAIVGADVDLFNAVAAKFGMTTQWTSRPFGGIIDEVQAGKYDVGVAAFSVNPDRERRSTMVSYFAAGSLWVVSKGNPQQVHPDRACGKTVAVLTDSLQADVDLPYRNTFCRGAKIKIVEYDSQDDATQAVATGKADATVTDSPVAHYAITQLGTLQTVGQIYDVAPYGFVLPKEQKEFGAAIAQALTELQADGTYDAILEKWDVGEGIETFAVNPSMG